MYITTKACWFETSPVDVLPHHQWCNGWYACLQSKRGL